MIIKLNRKIIIPGVCILLAGLIICGLIIGRAAASPENFAGGELHCTQPPSNEAVTAANLQEDYSSARFQRPSGEAPLANPYSFEDFRREDGKSPLITEKFEKPEDVILAYYGILREASNMLGFSGGCGTIGQSGLPYPYAYELLTPGRQREISLKQFTASFKGIGYSALLKLMPAFAPPGTSENIKYYMAEIEIITGHIAKTEKEYGQGSLFGYYYGLITVEQISDKGWKIKGIDYIAEDFLCAPAHGWFYLSDAMVQIVYGDNLKLIDKIDKTGQEGKMIHVYASGHGKSYRFDFVRISNGYDILLHENVLENGVWKEVGLLTGDWEYLKLSVCAY